MGKLALDRRSLLALGAATAAFSLARATGAAGEAALPKLTVRHDEVIRQAAGLRPFRSSGFLVKNEPLGGKTVIHNYGHGGCGVTLSWGTADMAAKLALETLYREAAVIGCGVVGLTAARLLQDRGFTVTIYASDLPPNTSSDVAAGAFGLTEIVSHDHETDEIGRRLAEAVRFSHSYFESLGERYGVRPMVMYMLGVQPIEAPWEFSITPDLFQFEILGPGQHSFPST